MRDVTIAPRHGIARVWSLVALALLLAACGRNPAKAVLGEWRSDAGRMMFYPDSEVVIEQIGVAPAVADSDSAAAAAVPAITTSVARYVFVDGRLRIRALAAEPADYSVDVHRDSLVLCSVSGPAHCFRMVRIPVRDR